MEAAGVSDAPSILNSLDVVFIGRVFGCSLGLLLVSGGSVVILCFTLRLGRGSLITWGELSPSKIFEGDFRRMLFSCEAMSLVDRDWLTVGGFASDDARSLYIFLCACL